jgi:hypothetical protein
MDISVRVDPSYPGILWKIQHAGMAIDPLCAHFDEHRGLPTQAQDGTFTVHAVDANAPEVQAALRWCEGIRLVVDENNVALAS